MSVRLNRLRSDYEGMKALRDQAALIDFESDGNPPDLYRVIYRCKGMTTGPKGEVLGSELHRLEIALHADYPLRAPSLKQLTPVFHPNFAPAPNAAICIDAAKWTPAETLPDLVLRFFDMITYRLYNSSHPYNLKAVAWAKENPSALPVERRGWAKETGAGAADVKIVTPPPAAPAGPSDDMDIRIVRR